VRAGLRNSISPLGSLYLALQPQALESSRVLSQLSFLRTNAVVATEIMNSA